MGSLLPIFYFLALKTKYKIIAITTATRKNAQYIPALKIPPTTSQLVKVIVKKVAIVNSKRWFICSFSKELKNICHPKSGISFSFIKKVENECKNYNCEGTIYYI